MYEILVKNLSKNKFVLFFVVAFTSFLTNSVFADGGVVTIMGINIKEAKLSSQKAVIFWDGKNETLILSTSFVSNSPEVAWIIPIPSKTKPEITLFNESIFKDMTFLFSKIKVRYKFHFHRHYSIEEMFLLFSIVLFIVSTILCSAYLILYFVKKQKKTKMLKYSGILFLLSIVFFIVGGLSLLTSPLAETARISSIKVEPIKLLEEKHIGNYHTLILKATNASYMINWLNERGFNVSKKLEKILQEYCNKKDFYFIVAKIDHNSGTVSPLAIKFQPEKPFYPMKMSSINKGKISIDLFLFANYPMSDESSYFKIKNIRFTNTLLSLLNYYSKIDLSYVNLYKNYMYGVWLRYESDVSKLNNDSLFSANYTVCEILDKFSTPVSVRPLPNKCLYDVAIALKNESICEKIYEYYDSYYAEKCLLEVAKLKNDSKICNKIKVYPDLRNKCYSYFNSTRMK